MCARTSSALLAACFLAAGAPALARGAVRAEAVAAEETFLASDALQGRGSATRDEAIAAAYVASQFQAAGLTPAPGMTGYLQPARVVRPRLAGAPVLTVAGVPASGLTLLTASGPVSGKLVVAQTLAAVPPGTEVLLLAGPLDMAGLRSISRTEGPKLIVVRESDETRARYRQNGGVPRMSAYLEETGPQAGLTIATLPDGEIDALARHAGATMTLDLPLTREVSVTTNAIGYIRGRDGKAGTLLFSAHLDHLGVRPDGIVMHGANDDASGTVAVIELARAMARGKPPKRSLLFVAYGSEEIGLFGSTYFGAHPPVPLDQIVANREFEMIGAQDPKLPKGALMMTGYERSDFGRTMKAHGAPVTADIYPEQHYFERSDNYALAKRGIVAHTVSGWGPVPTYHQPTDTLANLDLDFMTHAIKGLVQPLRWLANSEFRPQWVDGQSPQG